jgi:hypothetical protein
MRRVGLLVVGAFFAAGIAGKAIAADPGAGVAADLDVKGRGPQSNEERKNRAESMLAEMRQTLNRATEILKRARTAKDIVQLNCINEKLSQIKGLLRISEAASVKLLEGIAENAEDVVSHEFTKITVASRKVHALSAEAEQCVGESNIYSGDTQIDLEIDPTLRMGSPWSTPLPSLYPDVPPVASGS